MGFRFINFDKKLGQKEKDLLKQQQLMQETERWSNITQNQGQEEFFIDRYLQVKNNAQKHDDNENLEQIKKWFTDSKADLVSIQGNINIAHISCLLS